MSKKNQNIDLDGLQAGIAKPNRRGFLALVGVGAAGVALAACSSDNTTSTSDTTAASGGAGSSTTTAPMSPGSSAPSGGGGDLEVAALAAGLEVLAVNTYGAALEAATAGSLGTVPPAVAEYVTTAQAHHQAALDAWNAVLTGAGQPAVTEPPAELEATVNAEFAKVTDDGGAAARSCSRRSLRRPTRRRSPAWSRRQPSSSPAPSR